MFSLDKVLKNAKAASNIVLPILLHFVICSLQFPVHQFPPPAKEQAQEDLKQGDQGLQAKHHKKRKPRATQHRKLNCFSKFLVNLLHCAWTNMLADQIF